MNTKSTAIDVQRFPTFWKPLPHKMNEITKSLTFLLIIDIEKPCMRGFIERIDSKIVFILEVAH